MSLTIFMEMIDMQEFYLLTMQIEHCRVVLFEIIQDKDDVPTTCYLL